MELKSKNNSCMSLVLIFVSVFTANISVIKAASDSLKYIGHSFVKIKTAEGKVIFIDPYAVNDFSDSADVVLITHEHSDHNELSRVKQKKTCLVVRNGNYIVNGAYQSFTVGNIKIRSVAAYNSNHAKSVSVGYVIEFNNIKIYHAGDTGNITELADLAAEKITYAMIPMDGVYTMSPEVATQAAAVVKAKFDIPIHTMAPPDNYSNAIVARFTSPNKLVVKPGSTIELKAMVTSINKNELPGEFNLLQNFPNPFNPYTIISWQIAVNSFVTLKVYDIVGKEVATLVNEYKKSGNYYSSFSISDPAFNRHGSQLSSGVYFYTLATPRGMLSKKMILMK